MLPLLCERVLLPTAGSTLDRRADLLLMDDRRGVSIAKQQGLRVTGTLGVLDLASDRGLVNFQEAIHKLELTSFRRPEAVLKFLLAKHKDRKVT